jgi:GNAT superfamily N-acetyltransferase
MELRQTTAADLAAGYEVFRASIGELYERHRLRPPGPPLEVFKAMQGHLLQTDGERCHVAVEAGRVVGFASAMVRGAAWHLSSLFVLPDFQRRGLGRELLARVWRGDGVKHRYTLTDAIQPISNGMYARRGLIPTAPILHLVGAPVEVASTELEPDEPDAESLALVDRAAYGFDRAIDHAHWSTYTAGTLWRHGGEPVAYSYAWPQGRIGPLAAVDATTAGHALHAALTRARPPHAVVVAPGTAAQLIEAALAAGLQLQGPPGLLLLSRGTSPPTALALSSYTLL